MMAVNVTRWAYERVGEIRPTLDHKVSPALSKSVLACLADFAGPLGNECFPSIATIARRTSMAPRTVRYALRQLEASGLIVVIPRHRGNGSGASSQYVLRVDEEAYRDAKHMDERRHMAPSRPDSREGQNEDGTSGRVQLRLIDGDSR